MTLRAHLRDKHGYSLAESVQWAPYVMADLHAQEHERNDCGHKPDDLEAKGR